MIQIKIIQEEIGYRPNREDLMTNGKLAEKIELLKKDGWIITFQTAFPAVREYEFSKGDIEKAVTVIHVIYFEKVSF